MVGSRSWKAICTILANIDTLNESTVNKLMQVAKKIRTRTKVLIIVRRALNSKMTVILAKQSNARIEYGSSRLLDMKCPDLGFRIPLSAASTQHEPNMNQQRIFCSNCSL